MASFWKNPQCQVTSYQSSRFMGKRPRSEARIGPMNLVAQPSLAAGEAGILARSGDWRQGCRHNRQARMPALRRGSWRGAPSARTPVCWHGGRAWLVGHKEYSSEKLGFLE